MKAVPVENWTRTVGYYANFSNVNKGKQAEIRDRKLCSIKSVKAQLEREQLKSKIAV